MQKQSERDTRDGAILAVVLIVLLVVTTLGSGMIALNGASALEVSKAISNEEAFWVAEGGLELVKAISAKNRKPFDKISNFNSNVLSFNGSKFTASLDGTTATITFPPPSGWDNSASRIKRYNLISRGTSAGGAVHEVMQQAWIQTFASYMHASKYERTTSGNRIYFAGSDILDGTVYVNDQLNIYQSPQFLKKAFSAQATVHYVNPSNRHGVDHNVFQKGLKLNALPLDFENPNQHLDALQTAANHGGLSLNGSYGITFNPNGTITYRKRFGSGNYGAPHNKDLSTINGAIYVSGSAYISGKVRGSVTLASRSDIYITNDVIYASATTPDHSSSGFNDDAITDALGLIAKQGVTISRSYQYRRNDVNIHASILVTNGGFGCARRFQNIGNPSINLYGGLTQYRRGVVGQASWPPRGFSKNYRYDNHLPTKPPAQFPYSAYTFQAWRQTR